MHYPYNATASFEALAGHYFEKVDTSSGAFADGLMSGHIGLWDPTDCKVLQDAGTENPECKRFRRALPLLSPRSGGSRGPDCGMISWFRGLKAVCQWL